MIRFLTPEWFFILPALAFIAWKFPFLKLSSPLRAISLLLLVLSLTRPVIKSSDSGMDIWMLVDRSLSTGEQPMNASSEIHSILERSKRKNDRIFMVDFGKEAVLRDKGDPEFPGGRQSTRMAGAIDFILNQKDGQRTTRLLVLTDGYPTDSFENTASRLRDSRVALDYRLLENSSSNDLRIANLSIPSRVGPGESFLIEFDILGDTMTEGNVPWQITRGKASPLQGTAVLHKGKAHVKLHDRVIEPGGMRYDVSILPEHDSITENNKACGWTEITGGNKVLIISRYENDPMARFLRAQGFRVQISTNPDKLTPESLTGTRLVIINDVPCSKVNPEFLRSLDFFVTGQGGGLLMCGGKNSFGSGGYFHSSIDTLLPVSMELRQDEHKMMVAIAFILDRSGSMSCSTPLGKTKMQLAAEGTANAIDLMGDRDYVSVHAVDTEPHPIISMSQVGENRSKIISKTRRIESSGGGIYIEEGLEAGWRQLKKTDTGTRHLILFADAADSRQHPGKFQEVIKKMKDGHTTVSVIAMGSRKDCDADILEEIATLGEGRIFFNDNPADLTSIFTQETVSVARSAFLTDPVPASPTSGWAQISTKPIAWPQQIEAYNLSYLKDGATTAFITKDSYEAPLAAFWARGGGRAAAISFPMAGDHAKQTLNWPEYGNFVQTLSRWLAGNGAPDGFAIKSHVKGEQLDIELLYADRCIPQIARRMPQAKIELISSGSKTKIINGKWEHIQPGVFRTSFLLEDGERVRGAISLGDHIIPFGPIGIASAIEWNRQPSQKEAFMHTAKLSGGMERVEMSNIWNSPREIHSQEIRDYLLWALLVLLVADALLTRIGITLALPRLGAKIRREEAA